MTRSRMNLSLWIFSLACCLGAPTVRAIDLPPDDVGYVDVKRDFGAKGDGVTDDTAALHKAINNNKLAAGKKHKRVIYLPAGTYLVSDSLVWGDKKQTLQGAGRDATIIRLKDQAKGFGDPAKSKLLISTEFGHGGQNFQNSIRDLTVDIGSGNAGAVGVRFHQNNIGAMTDVTVRSSDPEQRGKTGLALVYYWPGPGLIRNVTIEGFDTGIEVARDQYSMTFEHITLLNQRVVGFKNQDNTVAVRGLISRNAVPVVQNQGKTALFCLVDADFTFTGEKTVATAPAIDNSSDGKMFVRDLRLTDYNGPAIVNHAAGSPQVVQGPTVREFVSHPAHRVGGPEVPQQSLRLPIKDPPAAPAAEADERVSVAAFGAIPDDDKDDSAAIQKAIDAGKPVVYFPYGTYDLRSTVHIRGKCRRLMGWESLLITNTGDTPALRIEDGDGEPVFIERLWHHYEGSTRYFLEHASKRTLVVRHSGCSYRNTVPGGEVFMDDVVGQPVELNGQRAWMRQLNVESYDFNPLVKNVGGDLWILCVKTEKDRTIVGTYGGGRTEVIGGLIYKNNQKVGQAPIFVVEESSLSASYRTKGEPSRQAEYKTHIDALLQGQRFTLDRTNVLDGVVPLAVSRSRPTSKATVPAHP